MTEHPKLSNEQIDWIADQTERAANTAATSAVRKYRRSAAIAYTLLLVGLLLAALSFQDYIHERQKLGQESRNRIAATGTAVARKGCEGQNTIKRALRVILADANRNTVKEGQGTKTNQAFFTASIKRLAPGDCGKIVVRK